MDKDREIIEKTWTFRTCCKVSFWGGVNTIQDGHSLYLLAGFI